MSIDHHQVHQGVIFSGGHTPHALAAPVLGAVGGDGDPLDVTPLAERYHDVFVGDKLLVGGSLYFSFVNDGPARFTVVLLELPGLFFYLGQDLLGVGQNSLQLANCLDQVLVLILQPFPFQSGQTAELHIQDGLGLNLAEVQLLHQPGASGFDVRGTPDDFHHQVHLVQRQQQALHHVVSVPGPVQQVFGTPSNHFLPVGNEQRQRLL